MQTSQVVDVISGGIKTNALPERATVTVNHRINIGETTKSQEAHPDLPRVRKFPRRSKLDPFVVYGQQARGGPHYPSRRLNQQPICNPRWDRPRCLWQECHRHPSIMTGNTNTWFFWNLTKHIFQFTPGYNTDDVVNLGKVHTVDEVSVLNHIHTVRWFVTLVRDMDEARFGTDRVAEKAAEGGNISGAEPEGGV
ncbi:hypothetical protein QBC36DRAFT_369553 [Triangularia setosa]|uniref:Peptidase M20 dimerisation domain-containing protein n=1 Tax=Triangularia setosa TaxID=2587417 RepID=A0AAN7A0J4_9PEZI|nr:hypothetical protein QBC36DRAFT_369553 [Podospora setosa]